MVQSTVCRLTGRHREQARSYSGDVLPINLHQVIPCYSSLSWAAY
ncbi:hypothetical protein EMIT0P74_110148 [Pseudomonas sp. IT-P74]